MRLLADGHREGEIASGARPRIDGEVAFMHAGDLARQPEAESRALDMGRRLDPAKPGEKCLLVLLRDAGSLAPHRTNAPFVLPPPSDPHTRAPPPPLHRTL